MKRATSSNSEKETKVLTKASIKVHDPSINLQIPTEYEPTTVVVITWSEMLPYHDSVSNEVSI